MCVLLLLLVCAPLLVSPRCKEDWQYKHKDKCEDVCLYRFGAKVGDKGLQGKCKKDGDCYVCQCKYNSSKDCIAHWESKDKHHVCRLAVDHTTDCYAECYESEEDCLDKCTGTHSTCHNWTDGDHTCWWCDNTGIMWWIWLIGGIAMLVVIIIVVVVILCCCGCFMSCGIAACC